MRPDRTRRLGTGPDFNKLYLVAPRHPQNFWSMQGTVDILGAKALMPNSALATLMALTPPDVNIEYQLADENVSHVDFSKECDLVVITGGTLHSERIIELCLAFRKSGKKIALGGTFASIEPDRCADLADYLFVGEAEYTWPLFLQEWSAGTASPLYHQKTYIDLKDSPSPDWSLIDVSDYVNINVQTSRGCPNQCDFCDVIHYVGRRFRSKSVSQVMTEVQNAHAIGARTVFFSDDNFLGNKRFTQSLLAELIHWNIQQKRPLSFSTQITVQVADDPVLLKMFADARFSVLFLGVETIRKKSLDEVHKSQNYERDLHQRIRNISQYGIVPFIGLIVGFDHDDESVFAELDEFIKTTASPIAGISLLNAPRHTALYHRLQKEGRLSEEGFTGEWQLHTNIIPKMLEKKLLQQLYVRFFKKIYQPKTYESRFLEWLRGVNYFNQSYIHKRPDPKQLFYGMRIFRHFLLNEDKEVRKMFWRLLKKTWEIDPRLLKRFFTVISQYSHFYNFSKTHLRE
ncbi:MAG: radical SAM protein [Desulfopila sp.]|jgi:radical SAM superfamily enzyme YgiQ (UPF0313 family)|nr:radical SAM protein [Desulfopila sp.]